MIKSYTDLEQSKKLAEILPIESADMWHPDSGSGNEIEYGFDAIRQQMYIDYGDGHPCWSFAALLNILPDGTDIVKDKADTENEKYMCTVGVKDDIISMFGNNPVDACADMIIKLHELNLL